MTTKRKMLRVLAALAIAVGALVGACADQQLTASANNPQGRAAIFDFVWQTISDHDALLASSGVDWDESRRRFRDCSVGAPPEEFYRALVVMVSELNDPHTSVEWPGALHESRLAASGMWGWVERRWVLLQRLDQPPAFDERPRLVLSSVDGVTRERADVSHLLCAPYPHRFSLVLVDAEGNEKSLTFDGACSLLGHAEIGLEAAKRAVVVHPALMAGTNLRSPCTLRHVLDVGTKGAQGADRVVMGNLTILRPAGMKPDSLVHALATGDWSGARPRDPWWLEAVDLGAAGYLRLSTVSDEKTDLSSARMAYQVRKAVESLRHLDRLIVDLRYNYGGTAGCVFGLLPYLVKENVRTNVNGYRHVLAHPDGYRGRITVLVNAHTASGGEWIAHLLRKHAGAVVVGETTRGAEFGCSEVRIGPDGTKVRCSECAIVDADGDGFQGVGLKPDVVVPLTLERVRQIGYVAAVTENELEQFRRACGTLGMDGEEVLREIAGEGKLFPRPAAARTGMLVDP